MDSGETYIAMQDLKSDNFIPLQSVKFDESKLYSQIFRLTQNFQNYGYYYADVDPTNVEVGKMKFRSKLAKFYNLEDTDIPQELWNVELPFDFPYKDNHVRTPK